MDILGGYPKTQIKTTRMIDDGDDDDDLSEGHKDPNA